MIKIELLPSWITRLKSPNWQLLYYLLCLVIFLSSLSLGSPYIYYGEELGMRGQKPDENIREPMLWKRNNDTYRAAWYTNKTNIHRIEPEYTTNETVRPVEEQMEDPNSILNHYRNLIQFRKEHQGRRDQGHQGQVHGNGDGGLQIHRDRRHHHRIDAADRAEGGRKLDQA